MVRIKQKIESCLSVIKRFQDTAEDHRDAIWKTQLSTGLRDKFLVFYN